MGENASVCDFPEIKEWVRDPLAGERNGMSAGVWVARYRVTLSFPQGLSLSNFSGFALHGVLGAALRELSPVAYRTLYGDDDIVHPWLLTPLAPCLAPGSDAAFELRLFNEAARFLPDLIGALMLAGCAGLGADRSPFDLRSVDILLPGEQGARRLDLAASAPPKPLALTDWCRPSSLAAPVRVSFVTPTALKAGNALVRAAPSFALLMSRTLARLSLLAKGRVLESGQKQDLLSAAREVGILHSAVVWRTEPRYSGRQQRAMPFGGLLGEMVYEASAAPFAPWLDAASLIGLGGKTTFGFGQLSWRS